MKQIITTVSLLVLFTQIAFSQVTVTLANNTSKDIFAVYGKYANEDDGITTHGWFKILPYQEFELNFGEYSGTIYFFAKGTDTASEGETKLCIGGNTAFKVLNADKINCERDGQFKSIRVKNGQSYKFIFNPSGN